MYPIHHPTQALPITFLVAARLSGGQMLSRNNISMREMWLIVVIAVSYRCNLRSSNKSLVMSFFISISLNLKMGCQRKAAQSLCCCLIFRPISAFNLIFKWDLGASIDNLTESRWQIPWDLPAQVLISPKTDRLCYAVLSISLWYCPWPTWKHCLCMQTWYSGL